MFEIFEHRLSNRLGKVKVLVDWTFFMIFWWQNLGEISCAKPSKGPSHNPASMACSFVWKCSTASWHDWREWGFWGWIKSMTNGHDIEWKIGKTTQQCSSTIVLSKIWKFKISQAYNRSFRCCYIESWFTVYCSHISQCHSQLFHPTGRFFPVGTASVGPAYTTEPPTANKMRSSKSCKVS